MCNPPLSSIDTNAQQIGYKAAELMDRLLHGRKPPDKPLLVRPRGLVTRQSSDVVAIKDKYLAKAMSYIRTHAGEPMTVKRILRQVPVCRKILERKFIETFGRTPKAEINRVRISARVLLQETDLPIPAVARGHGFVCTGRFSCFFRSHVGRTPSGFRLSSRMIGR